MSLSAALLQTTLPAADQSLLEVTDVGYSGAPNLFYNDGPAKKFSVGLKWNGATAVRCPFPEIRFAADGGTISDQTICVSKDGERDVTLQPGETLQRFFRINEVSFRHNKKEFALQFHAETDGLRHIARTPGIYVQAKKTRSVKNQRRQKAERGANRRRGGRATSLPIAAAVGRPSNDVQQELRRLRARVVRLEQENGRLRGRVRELEGGDQPAPLKRVKTEGLVVSTTMLAPPLVPKAPPRPQLIPIPSELKFGAFDEDFLQSMELLKSLTPRAAPLSNGCSTKRPRSDSTTSLADFLNAFGDFAPTPDLTDSS